MSVPYIPDTYIYPPRPRDALPPERLGFLAKRGWLGQVKKNGTNSVIIVAPDGTIKAMNRHAAKHKAWAPTEDSSAFFRKASKGHGWAVFNAELLHSKVPGIRDINYLHDILVWDNEYLVGSTYAERYRLLESLCGRPNLTAGAGALSVDSNTWLAAPVGGPLRREFDMLSAPEDEGLVLKNPNGRLEMARSEENNCGWLAKCRRPHKNFNF